MFDNVEERIKFLAKLQVICGYIVAVLVVISGLLKTDEGLTLGEFIFDIAVWAALWIFIGYCGAWLSYAFAEILESIKDTNQTMREMNETLKLALQKEVQQGIEENQRLEEEKRREEKERQAKIDAAENERRQAAIVAEQKRKQRIAAYWEAHPEEKKALLAKREQAISALNSHGKITRKEKAALQQLIKQIDDELNRSR